MKVQLTAVTGASGHVGANLVRALLKRGRKVRVLIHRDRRAVEGLDVEKVEGDILDRSSLKRLFSNVDSAFHLASFISITDQNRDLLESTNVQGTQNVADICRECGVKRLIHFSSVHAFSHQQEGSVTHEGLKLNLNGKSLLYDKSKAKGRRIVQEAVQHGLDAVIVNPSGIIGPNDFKVSKMGRAILDIYHHRYLMLVDGGFDWVDARDVTEGALAAEADGKPGECYLLSGHWVHMSDVSRMISRLSGKRTPKKAAPLWLAEFGSYFNLFYCRLTGKTANLTPDAIKTLRFSQKISHDKASRELGYQPRSFEETVRDTLDWFREHGFLEN